MAESQESLISRQVVISTSFWVVQSYSIAVYEYRCYSGSWERKYLPIITRSDVLRYRIQHGVCRFSAPPSSSLLCQFANLLERSMILGNEYSSNLVRWRQESLHTAVFVPWIKLQTGVKYQTFVCLCLCVTRKL